MSGNRRKRWAAAGLLAAALGSQGCLSCLNPVEPLAARQAECCLETSPTCRRHVYTFLLNGLDPLGAANVAGVRKAVIDWGYIKTYYGELYHADWFAREITRLSKDDPDARFALVGYGVGAAKAQSLARELACAGVTVDVLVFVNGVGLDPCPCPNPAPAKRVLNVSGECHLSEPPHVEGADNVNVPAGWHHTATTHGGTLELLAAELAALAKSVPVDEEPPSPVVPDLGQGPEPLPPPRARGE